MLVVKYTPPASAQSGETLDVTDYVIRAVWSGDAEQAARKLELEVAYNSPEKDKAFQNLDLRLGGKIEALYQDDYGQQAQIFSGRVFYRKRATDTYSFSIVAYDNMIYLAKSKVHMVFNNATVTDAVKRVCNEIGISVNENNPLLNTVVSFIADGKSCTEVINILLEKARADTGLKYNEAKHRWDGGKVYDPTRGIRANATCFFGEDGMFRLKGSLLGFSQTVIWEKIE